MTEEVDSSPMSVAQELPHSIGLVVDDEIVDIIYVDERLHAIFASNPTLIDLSNPVTAAPVGSAFRPKIGWSYNKENNTVFALVGDSTTPTVVSLG